jgi:hypothetical protein
MTSSSPAPAPQHVEAPRDLAAWTRWFAAAEIPVLPETAEALEPLRANEDKVDANSLGEMISGDPLMTLKVLAYESRHRSRRVITSAETVISALVMMGISPFFRAFSRQQTIDERLCGAAGSARGPAARAAACPSGRQFRIGVRGASAPIPDACRHPCRRLAARIRGAPAAGATHPISPRRFRRCRTPDPELRSSVAQRAVLNVELAELQRGLGGRMAACRP